MPSSRGGGGVHTGPEFWCNTLVPRLGLSPGPSDSRSWSRLQYSGGGGFGVEPSLTNPDLWVSVKRDESDEEYGDKFELAGPELGAESVASA